MKIPCRLFFCAAAWGQLLAAAAAPALTSTSTNPVALTPAYVGELAEEMRTNHPALQASSARMLAAQHATNAVRTWEDPTLKFGGVTTSSRGPDLAEDGDLVYGLEQKLPLFGKARAARGLAQAGAEVESARRSYQFQTLRRDLAKALFQIARSDRGVELGAEDVVWLDSMVASAEEQYRAGTGKSIDLFRLQNERARRVEQLRTDRARRDHERLSVNRLLNRDLQAPLPPFLLPSVARPIEYNPKLAAYATRFEPKLRLMENQTREAEAALNAARKARWPDVSAGVEGRQYSGDGGFREGAFLVSLNLPWLNRRTYRGEVGRTADRLRAAELDAVDYQLSVQEEVHALTVNIDAARREALLYAEEILPRSRQALASAHANWQANQGPLFDVLEARRMVIEAQLVHARAVTQQYQLMSELVLCCGLGDLEALEALGAIDTPTP